MNKSILLLLAASSAAQAFVTFGGFQRALATKPLCVSWWDQDEESYQRAMANNIARTDIRNFLTQRSIQSFMDLLNSCRDPHTVRWLEDFGGWRNMVNYHGLGALNNTRFPTWDTVLLELMEQPEDVLVVSAKRRGRGHGGWSKNNPYLQVSTKSSDAAMCGNRKFFLHAARCFCRNSDSHRFFVCSICPFGRTCRIC